MRAGNRRPSLTAVDLKSGEILWQVPLGTTRDQAPFPLWLTLGVPSFGGGLATAGGLYFTGATMDKYFRAFDTQTGEEVWRVRTPFAGNAAPTTARWPPCSSRSTRRSGSRTR